MEDMFTGGARQYLQTLLQAETELYRKRSFPLFGLVDTAPSPKATGDAKSDGSSLSLTYGDYTTRKPPMVFVYTSLPNAQPNVADLLDLEQRETHRPLITKHVQTISVSIDGATRAVDGLGAGPMWAIEIPRKGSVVTVFSSGWSPLLVELEPVTDVEPYLAGRGLLLERLGIVS